MAFSSVPSPVVDCGPLISSRCSCSGWRSTISSTERRYFTGAIAVHIHGFVAGDVGLLVGLPTPTSACWSVRTGLYAYVVDGYVGDAFRVAFFLYRAVGLSQS